MIANNVPLEEKFIFTPSRETDRESNVFMRLRDNPRREDVLVNVKTGEVIKISPKKVDNGFSWEDDVIQLNI